MSDELEIPIAEFRGRHRFLSNFYDSCFCWRGYQWSSAEHAFQACKTTSPEEFERVRLAATAAQAKTAGRQANCRPDWESIKAGAMLDILRAKFAPGTELARQLLATGEAPLIEGNRWHDRTWGVCNCRRCGGRGQNMLGEILMRIRTELRSTDERQSTPSL